MWRVETIYICRVMNWGVFNSGRVCRLLLCEKRTRVLYYIIRLCIVRERACDVRTLNSEEVESLVGLYYGLGAVSSCE